MANHRRRPAVPVPFPFDHHPFPILPPLIPLPLPRPFFPHRYYPNQTHGGPTPTPDPVGPPPVVAAEVTEAPADDVLEEGVEDGEVEQVLVLTDEWMEFFAKSEAKRKADKKKQKKQRKWTN